MIGFSLFEFYDHFHCSKTIFSEIWKGQAQVGVLTNDKFNSNLNFYLFFSSLSLPLHYLKMNDQLIFCFFQSFLLELPHLRINLLILIIYQLNWIMEKGSTHACLTYEQGKLSIGGSFSYISSQTHKHKSCSFLFRRQSFIRLYVLQQHGNQILLQQSQTCCWTGLARELYI